MIRSLFIINSAGDVVIEKHWRGLSSRLIVDHFVTEIAKYSSPKEVPPVVTHPRYSLVNLLHDNLYLIAVVQSESPPLLAIEFLKRVVDVLCGYFKVVTEDSLKDHFTTVYMVLDEMCDNGLPFQTELNTLQELVNPRSLGSVFLESLDKLPTELLATQLGSSVSGQLPAGAAGTFVPWRRAGVKYANNEIYVDIIETIHAIVDSNQMLITAAVDGAVQVNCKLSGTPDLTLSFQNSRILDDVSLHPCVRYMRWEQNRVMSFVPPDGQFTLFSYRVNTGVDLPVYCKPQITWDARSGVGRVTLMVGSKGGDTTRTIEDVTITIPFPRGVTGATLTSPVGTIEYDDATRVAVWRIGRLPRDSPQLNGTVAFGGAAPDSKPVLTVDFKIIGFASTGLKVDALTLHGESYTPWKGVRAQTRGGPDFQIRS